MEKIFQELTEIKTLLQQNKIQGKTYLSVDEACAYLSIAKSTLYKHTSSGAITFYRPNGKLILFKKEDLNAWIEASKVSHFKSSTHA